MNIWVIVRKFQLRLKSQRKNCSSDINLYFVLCIISKHPIYLSHKSLYHSLPDKRCFEFNSMREAPQIALNCFKSWIRNYNSTTSDYHDSTDFQMFFYDQHISIPNQKRSFTVFSSFHTLKELCFFWQTIFKEWKTLSFPTRLYMDTFIDFNGLSHIHLLYIILFHFHNIYGWIHRNDDTRYKNFYRK